MQTVLKPFDALAPAELYKLLQLRQDVFIIEQHCIYRDLDDKDVFCHHLFLEKEGEILAYCRLVPPGISYEGSVSIGRVSTARSQRMEGLGLLLMEKAMESAAQLWPGVPVCISAQAYLEKFYFKFGFSTISEPYLEDDIPHIKMISNNG
jgi:ElaA protein